jgi:DNA polymerase
MRQITFAPNFPAWQKEARRALQAGWSPLEVIWEEFHANQPPLALFDEGESPSSENRFRVPREFLNLATQASCHRDPRRWALLYETLWRLTHGEPKLLEISVDPTVNTLLAMQKSVRHDIHKMRAFVRFRAIQHQGDMWYVAWFEPTHHIVEANAPFFIDRFANMYWSILTPERCVHWDGTTATFTEGVPKSEAPTEDAVEGLWTTYYSNIFNPARIKTHAMQAEMPKKYWRNLPEAAVINTLLREAPQRVERMIEASTIKSSDEWHSAEVPSGHSLEAVREAARDCTACPLYRNATQTVFGEGPRHATVVFVGEQPGDSEDRAGQPFVGPAGQLFNKALGEAGIDRTTTYVTNAVKHFKWEPRGKRRLHQKPSARDVAACRPWLEKELELIQPKIIVCLGATAAQALLGSQVRVLRDRGKFLESEFSDQTLVTIHPSALLRAPTDEAKDDGYEQFVADLREVAKALAA